MNAQGRWLVAALLLLSACWNFDEAYFGYCDAGRCTLLPVDAGHDAGTLMNDSGVDGGEAVSDAGVKVDAGPVTDAGPFDAGPFDAGPFDAGPFDAGPFDAGPFDAGMAIDAGFTCLGWGQSCGSKECCPFSDAGIRMSCSRNNLCQEYAADCKESGFDCSDAGECCGQKCIGQRCAMCLGVGVGPCTRATDCCPGSSCSKNGTCVYAGTASLGAGDRCASSGYCATKYCNQIDAGPNDGVCENPDGCSPLGSSVTSQCCPGLDAGATCCLPDTQWCFYSSHCCSGNCVGHRCINKSNASLGERCWSGAECGGLTTLCNPVGLTCSNRVCLPVGANPYSGCCTIISASTCRFADGSNCLLFSASTSSPANCCSGQTNGTTGNYTCTEMNY